MAFNDSSCHDHSDVSQGEGQFASSDTGSTRSLLTPIYASDYESKSGHHWTSDSDDAEDFDHRLSRPSKCSTPYKKSTFSETKTMYECRNSKSPSSWEDWVVRKTLESLEIRREKRLQERLKKVEEKKKEATRIDKLQEAEVKRSEWLEKKQYEQQKRRKEATAHRKYMLLKQKQTKELTEGRSKEKFVEWCRKKKEEESQRKKAAKEEAEKMIKKIQERKAINDLNYLNWLKNDKMKRRNISDVPGSSEQGNCGKMDLFGSFNPHYVNPNPWVDICDIDMAESRLDMTSEPYQSPPLLWRDRDQRKRTKIENLRPRQQESLRARTVKQNGT